MLFLKSNMKKEKVRKSENNLPKCGKRRGHLWQILLPYVPVNGRPVCKVCWRRFSSLSMMQDGQEKKNKKWQMVGDREAAEENEVSWSG